MTPPATLTLVDLAQQAQADEARAYEEQVAQEAVGDSDGILGEVLATAAALWAAKFGTVTAAGAGADLVLVLAKVWEKVQAALAGLGARARRVLLAGLPGAIGLGMDQARAFARAGSGSRVRGVGHRPRPSQVARDAAEGLVDMVAGQLRRAAVLLSADVVEGRSFAAVAAGISAARSAVSRVRGAVAWAVHESVRVGGDAVARALGLQRVWVAERDACVRCQAYAGEVAPVGGTFKGGQSWDPRQRESGADRIAGPPLHPHCRCRLALWSPRWPHRGLSLPEALAAQGREAVARGWALPSESGAARVRAARQLLDSGVPLPPEVERAAWRALREGRFARA